ncbi:hypothetical protein MCM47_40080, partial [Kitasatospora sp. A2-31]|nr:hypothetical protein [Kitasatospora sp. A2-31]
MSSRRGPSQDHSTITERQRRRPIAAVAAAAALFPTLFSASACGGPADAATKSGDLTVMTWAPSGTGSADRPGMTALAEAIGKDINTKGG